MAQLRSNSFALGVLKGKYKSAVGTAEVVLT